MKVVLLVVFAVVLFLIFRRLNREQRVTPEQSWGTQPSSPTPIAAGLDKWSGRAAMSFDDFYSQYYASASIDREHVRKMLDFVSKAGGVPADRIRPEDRIDEFPRKNLARTVGFIEKLVTGPLARLSKGPAPDPASFHLVTVDDIMRHLDMHTELVSAHIERVGEAPKEDSQWH